MLHSTATRWIVGTMAVIAVLGLLRFKPWQLARAGGEETAGARETLQVGFLPVT